MVSASLSDDLSLLAATAAVLHANGQQTAETMRMVERTGIYCGILPKALFGWDGVILHGTPSANAGTVLIVDATPAGVGMNRVIAASHAIEQAISQRLTIQHLQAKVMAAAALPPFSDQVFALANAAAATALAVTFGATQLSAIVLIFVSGGAGAYLRRLVARLGANALVQTFLAALLAGLVGASGVRCDISSELRLIAVCPCMVLVPGPHFLNATLDLLAIRLPLGAARLGFAGLILVAICIGLLVGLTLCGVALPVTPPARDVALWRVTVAAGVAAASYSIFFSLPLKYVGWPVGASIAADTARWAAMTVFHAGPAFGAGVAALVAGTFLVPVSRLYHLPFAGIGFASIVSLIPGMLAFHIAGGLIALPTASPPQVVPLIKAMVLDSTTAILIIIAMTIAIISPRYLYDAVSNARRAGGTAE
jgi:uncharacterized membrane protein YjjP (DUF1212 family)